MLVGSLYKKIHQNGDAMTRLRRISLPLILLSVVGCATRLQPEQPSQVVAEKIPEEQPRNPRYQHSPIALEDRVPSSQITARDSESVYIC
jgi:hypothetical protein